MLSGLFDLPATIAVVCHDSGAANLILAWIRDAGPHTGANSRYLMQGPAARLMDTSGIQGKRVASLEEALVGSQALLSGTGWQTTLEHDARVLARRMGIRCVGVIDHWVNYSARFTRDGITVWPDEFWIADRYAQVLAAAAFPGQVVRLQPDAYTAQQVSQIPIVPDSGDVLYVMEPIQADWGRGQPGEFQALDYFLKNMQVLGIPADKPIRLRPHPSDAVGKYDEWLRGQHRIALDTSDILAAAIAPAQYVAGCETLAMVVALAAKRTVVCTLPPWAPACRLPQGGIIHLKEIAAQATSISAIHS